MKIFIIEDDPTIRQELGHLLEKNGYETEAPDEFADIIQMALEAAPHLILLDLGLPVHDGHHICREIRRQSEVPIIVVTSRNTEIDELMSMQLGADDFISKPYHTQILLAHIESVLRRAYGNQDGNVICVNEVTLNYKNSTVNYQNQTLELTKNEVKILSCLMKSHGSIISRDDIMMELWNSDEFVDDNTLTVNVNRLRRKLEEIGLLDWIKTKRGQGYLI